MFKHSKRRINRLDSKPSSLASVLANLELSNQRRLTAYQCKKAIIAANPSVKFNVEIIKTHS